MSDDEIRVAIAEKCGWLGPFGLYRRIASGKQILGGSGTLHGTPPCDKEKPKDDQAYEPVPDYPHDLNACHEFWQSMSDEDQERFCKELHSVSCPEDCRGLPWHCSYVINATARQRCEAFLRVHGLWKDNPTPERSEGK